MSDDLPDDMADTISEAIEKAVRLAKDDGPWHVLPNNDLRDHIDTDECWCSPIEVEDDVWVHRPLDGRDEYERGRKPS